MGIFMDKFMPTILIRIGIICNVISSLNHAYWNYKRFSLILYIFMSILLVDLSHSCLLDSPRISTYSSYCSFYVCFFSSFILCSIYALSNSFYELISCPIYFSLLFLHFVALHFFVLGGKLLYIGSYNYMSFYKNIL